METKKHFSEEDSIFEDMISIDFNNRADHFSNK